MTDEELKARHREYMREYYKANCEKIRKHNREYMREYRKRKAAEA